MRGTAPMDRISCLCSGITPARAGNSKPVTKLRGSLQDHPRACGEQCDTGRDAGGNTGSPPRVRGTAVAYINDTTPGRITPARAGNRFLYFPFAVACWDHPRACGEQDVWNAIGQKPLGSPPRVRGTVHATAPLALRKRITPARAGNSVCRSCFITK